MEVVEYIKEATLDFAADLLPKQGGCFSNTRSAEIWKPPPRGVFKINVDAAFSKGDAAFACIVRDDFGCLVMAASSLGTAPLVFAAELMAVYWAISLAESKGWRNIIISSDALNVVKEVHSLKKPSG